MNAEALIHYSKLYVVAWHWKEIYLYNLGMYSKFEMNNNTLRSQGKPDEPGFKSSYGQEIFLFSKLSRPAMGQPSLPFNANRGSFPGVKRLGCEVNHSSPSSAEVNNECSYISTALICHHGIEMENLSYLVRCITVLCRQILTHQIVNTDCYSGHQSVQIQHSILSYIHNFWQQ
jgi:hypothetical protein